MTMRWALPAVAAIWLGGLSVAVPAQTPPTATAPPGLPEAFRGDVHDGVGVTCADCHGAGPAGGYGVVARTAIPKLCARCHADTAYMKRFDPQVRTDQYAQYLTSTHGRQHAKGETRVAVCSDCHLAHGVRRVKDPRSPVAPPNVARTCGRCHGDAARMTPFGKDDLPPAEWAKSVHAKALVERGDTSAPTCNTCHGSHGAAPPEVESVALVCAQCHVREATLFRGSPKKGLFDSLGFAECVTCHGNHAIEHPPDSWIGFADGVGCGACHDDTIPGAETIKTVRQGLDDLTSSLAEATSRLDRAEQSGVIVDDGLAALREAHEQQIHARVAVHAFATAPFADVHEKGMEAARRAVAEGDRGLGEVRYRRRGLAIATIFIAGFLITLLIKIRRLGPGEPPPASPVS